MTIGLTLSGGGFRATLFHLGVIQYLRKANLLKDVKQITSVSGGSVIAAHVAANWDRYSGTDEQFKQVSKELIGFTQLGVREHIVLWLPFLWIWRQVGKVIPGFLLRLLGQKNSSLFTYNQSSLLSTMYARHLFKEATNASLETHENVPNLNMAATNLSRPENLVTFSGTGLTLHGVNGYSIPTQAFRLAHAVTASSAFPLLFPAIRIDSEMLGETAGKLIPSPQYLSDGGIFDNYGIRALFEIRRDQEPFELLIVSDAGARAEWQPDVSFGSISLLNRAAAITGQRVGVLELESAQDLALAARTAIVSIHDAEVPAASPQNLKPDLQKQLGKVRTDLDSFSDLLVHCLGSHGFAVARKAITAAGFAASPEVPQHWNPLEPNNPVTDDLPAMMSKLQEEAFLRWRLFNIKQDWRAVVLYILVGLAAYYFLPSAVVGTMDKVNQWLREFERSAWTETSLKIQSNKFGDQALLTSMQDAMSEEEKDQFRMKRWLRWINDGIRPSSQREKVLFLESEPFDSYYREFTISIACEKHIKLAEGVAFLVSSEGPVYKPVYRQVKMRFDPTGQSPPTITLASPNRGEHLLLILRAQSLESDPEAKLPSTTSAFHINLETK